MSAELEKRIEALEAALRKLPNAISDAFRGPTQRRIVDLTRTFTLDTSQSVPATVDLRRLLGARPCVMLNVLSVGGGFTMNLDEEKDFFTATAGLSITDEKHSILNWKGSGVAGTAVLRIGAYLE